MLSASLLVLIKPQSYYFRTKYNLKPLLGVGISIPLLVPSLAVSQSTARLSPFPVVLLKRRTMATTTSLSITAAAAKTHPTTLLSPRSPRPTALNLRFTPPAAAAIRSRIRYSATADPVTTPLIAPQPRTLKTRLADGDTLYGLFLLSASPTLAEIAGLAGYDYVVVDMEHGPGGISDALPCLRALASVRTPAILRLPEPSAAWAKKALDLGPQGIMFPTVESSHAAELSVSYCRFPPKGIRGSAHTVVRASGYGINDEYLERCEDELLIMCQVETVAGVEQIEAIAAVEGVDCVQMGPLDLSASMGYLWNPGHRKVREVLREAERRVLAVKKAAGDVLATGPYLGGFAMPHDQPEDLKKRGYHMVAGAVDLGMFRKAAVDDVTRFHAAGPEDVGEDNSDKGDDESYWSE